MKCTVCGSNLLSSTTDLPFKVSDHGIVILRKVPVLQCDNCTEYLIEDPVFERVEKLLAAVDEAVELEIIQFAA